ncbi:hypothetical protein P3X46_014171 [Hevea brasiliensis]|uniref:Protein kinase domain-containing protein n=1 Tax=Hevea brasiliensis TaxID=3981 RepID=A0ABQ9M7K2_HEVBR|nr:hypothetical protein P3X46_014171 [Hevea brasiliensis]
MWLCFSSEAKSQSDPHFGMNDTSNSSSKVSSATEPSTPQTNGEILQSHNLKSFGFSELKEATSNFSKDVVLGGGDFGFVCKGWIDEHSLKPVMPKTGMPVAVKRLNKKGCQGQQEWFLYGMHIFPRLRTEIKYLGQLRHPNIVKLIGYCLEDDHRLLFSRDLKHVIIGAVDSHFQPLSWVLCMKVALGAAKVLAFLRDKADVIHRDFKTSNILLYSNYNAKLSDLGLAKDGPTGRKTHVSTRALGTEGYAAPDYMRTVTFMVLGLSSLKCYLAGGLWTEPGRLENKILVEWEGLTFYAFPSTLPKIV